MPPQAPNDFVVELKKEPSLFPPSPKKKNWAPFFTLIPLAILCYGAFSFVQAPSSFTANTLVEIPEGFGLSQIVKIFESDNVVRSPMLLKVLIKWHGNESKIPAGAYLFKTPPTVFEVARRLSAGMHGVERLRVLLPEGTSLTQMADILGKALPAFDSTEFLALTKGAEGYLFPDTYFFFSTANALEVATTLKENFLKKTEDLKGEAVLQQKEWGDIVIMASLIEEETMTPEDRRIVSGILWKRLALGMPLQVDAPFSYIKGRATTDISLDDLAIDSPYNTYKYRGLPPTPITNSGLDALDAALHPVKSEYLYYLSDKEGILHYGKTFEEHKKNKEKYLR